MSMKAQHQSLANGRWQNLSFAEQMANVGSEVERSLNWQSKNKTKFMDQALNRALELLNLSISTQKTLARTKELARVKETLLDYFWGNNQYRSQPQKISKYFYHFNYLARK